MSLDKYRSAMRQFAKDYEKSTPFGGDWYPPNASYQVALIDVREDTFTKDGQEVLLLVPDVCILSGEYANRKFPLGKFNQQNFGVLKGVIRSINDGIVPDTLDQCIDLLVKAAASNLAMQVEVSEYESTKNKRKYKNVNVTSVFPLGVTESAPKTDAPTDDIPF